MPFFIFQITLCYLVGHSVPIMTICVPSKYLREVTCQSLVQTQGIRIKSPPIMCDLMQKKGWSPFYIIPNFLLKTSQGQPQIKTQFPN